MKTKRLHIKFMTKILLLVPLILFGTGSYAGLDGVKKIIITSSSSNTSQWLQVSEVVAIESGSQKDIALTSKGATAKGTSFYSKKSHAGNAISGVAPNRYPKIYHSGGKDKSPILEITLASPSQLDSITIYGRADCCTKRDFYNLKLMNANNKIIFQKFDIDASNKAHSAQVNLVKSSSKNERKAKLATVNRAHSVQVEAVKVNNQKSSNVNLETVNNNDNKPIAKSLKTETQPVLKAKEEEKKVSTKYRSKSVSLRPKDYYRDLFKKGFAEVEAENFDSAVKYFDQIIFDKVNYSKYSNAKYEHDYWIKSAKREKNLAYAKKNIDRSKDLYDDETIQGLFVKAIKATLYEIDYPLAKKMYREIMDHTLEYSSNYNRAKSELDGMDAYIAKKKAKDKKNKILADKIRAKEKVAQERMSRNEEQRKYEQEKAAELRRQVILNNNKRYPLNLEFSSSSMISYDQMEIGKTKKDDAIKIYDRLLKEQYAKEVVEDDMTFMLRQVLSGPRIKKRSLLVNQSSFNIHDSVTLQCFKYHGKYSNKIVNDCLYFYKDTLVGGRFNRGFKTPESVLDLLPYFPVKEHYAKTESFSRLERSNNKFSMRSLTGGYTITTKTTRKTALTPLGVTSYSSNNNTVGLICISPKELNEMLADFSKIFSYSCH